MGICIPTSTVIMGLRQHRDELASQIERLELATDKLRSETNEKIGKLTSTAAIIMAEHDAIEMTIRSLATPCRAAAIKSSVALFTAPVAQAAEGRGTIINAVGATLEASTDALTLAQIVDSLPPELRGREGVREKVSTELQRLKRLGLVLSEPLTKSRRDGNQWLWVGA